MLKTFNGCKFVFCADCRDGMGKLYLYKYKKSCKTFLCYFVFVWFEVFQVALFKNNSKCVTKVSSTLAFRLQTVLYEFIQ